ncbi:hypothetical protein [Paracoccus aminovorans]|uniref:hypothetical protein n=1 Tax=Paracoccus aminovorans TaxID=34004 RepID=UPI0009450CE7|nr:hypothetical protein [Paracoccus aminovorans]
MDEAPSEHVVTMESAALRQMADALGELARDLPSIDPVKNPDIFEGFRTLILRVIVHDREDGRVMCEIIGDIAPLVGGIGADFW